LSRAILTINTGSSSLKFALFAAVDDVPTQLAAGQVEGLGANPRFLASDARGGAYPERTWPAGTAPETPAAALPPVLEWLQENYPQAQVDAVGHRVVHGGPNYTEPVMLDTATLEELARYVPLAPLHQPFNLEGIEAARDTFPKAHQVACFDTAFHRAHPWVNDVFAIPRSFYDEGVRRYGFHGLSYESVTQELTRVAPVVCQNSAPHYAARR
jgi:acetate kinase